MCIRDREIAGAVGDSRRVTLVKALGTVGSSAFAFTHRQVQSYLRRIERFLYDSSQATTFIVAYSDADADLSLIHISRTSEPNSGSSQFFIAKARATHLDTGYANFGMVLEGMDAVMAVPSRDQANTSAPLDEESRIVKARLVRFEGYETAQQELLKQLQEAQTEESSDDTESEGGNVATDSESCV